MFEYVCPVFSSSLTAEQVDTIERLQRASLKTIFGLKTSYSQCLEKAGIPTLAARRDDLVKNFAVKMRDSPRFGSRWFPQKQPSGYALRKEDRYKQNFAHCDRLRKAPLYHMRALLNQIDKADSPNIGDKNSGQ